MPVRPHLADARRDYSGPDRVIDAIRQALIVLDEKLRVVSANRAFCDAFAVMREEVVGQHLAEVGDHRLDVPALRGLLGLLQAEDAAIDGYEIEIELPALGRRALLLSAEKIRGETETTFEIVVTIDDVTERERAETTLKSAKWLAERANLTKSRLLAAFSHDLRQPLQTLSLLRGILAKKIKDKNDDEALKLVVRLDETAGALSGMLDTFRESDRLRTGIVHPEKTNFSINDLLEQLRIEFAYHAQIHGLLWHVVPCELRVRSDPRLLQHMIRDLLWNAVAYTERGKILLGCRRRGDKLRIEVRYTGVGPSEGQLRANFGKLHQLDNAVCEGDRGVGFTIVRRLGALLGHAIDAQSRPGSGSVFAIEVPLGQEQSEALPRGRPRDIAQRVGRRATILVIEDDPTMREMLDLLFANEGYRTATAADGKQALTLAQWAIRPDLLVADYTLSNGLTGLQIVARVREVLGREIPAVILTSEISTDTVREITRQSCVQCNKSASAEKLTHLIQSLLTQPRRPTARAAPRQVESKDHTQPPAIFVVDDDSAVRETMRELLEEEGWSVEIYPSGEAFLEGFRPGREGCLVIDAWMPGMGGLELLERLKTDRGAPPAIVITGHADIRLAVRAMKAGAMAFLEKPVRYDELIVNVERALELTRNLAALSSLRETATKRIAGLTSRERQVVEMVVKGNPNKQVAYVLGISRRTVETHRATAMKKIGVRTLSELIHLTIVGSLHDT